MINILTLLYNIREKGHLIYLNSNNELVLRKNKENLLLEEEKSALVQNKKHVIEILSENNIYSSEDFLKKRFLKFNIEKYKDSLINLSPIQQGIYLQSLKDNIKTTYNIPAFLNVKNLDANILEQAAKKLLLDHKVLRTKIGLNFQCSFEDMNNIIIKRIKLKTEEISKYIDDSSQYTFKLTDHILITPEICEIVDSNECIINLTHHHVLTDAFSVEVMKEQLINNYYCFIDNNKIPDNSMALDYFDYIPYQNHLFSKEDFQKAIKNLSDKLMAAKPLQLSAQNISFKNLGTEKKFDISSEKLKHLYKLSSKASVSLYTLLITTWYYIFKVYSSADEIFPVNLTVSNRKDEFSDTIGPFISTLPLIVDFCEDSTLLDNLRKVNSEIIFLNQYGDINFNQIVKETEIQPDRISDLMQLMFTMHNVSSKNTENKKLEAEFIEVKETTEKFGISIICKEYNGKLAYQITYANDRYESWLIEKIFSNYEYLLNNISIKFLEMPVKNLPILSEEEYQTIIYDWNDTCAPYPKDKTIHQLFEEQVEKTPGNTAVVFKNEQLTYHELNEKANQLAHFIRSFYKKFNKKEIQSNTLIGIYIERSVEMIIAILGILKAGAAYVPFDKADPEERLKFKINDSSCRMVLTSSDNLKDLLFLTETDAFPISLDSYWEEIDKYSKLNPDLINTPVDIAYMIYTSGSTGKPKGVMNYHNSLVNRLYWMREHYFFNEEDRILQKTPYSFDVSVWELLLPLISGAQLAFITPESHKNPQDILDIIDKRDITRLHFVPSMLDAFLAFSQEEDSEKFSSIKSVFCSGEALSVSTSRKFKSLYPHVELNNLYGPTEAAIDVTYFDNITLDDNLIPIGRPIWNTTVYVLSEMLHPVPVGVPGELYIGGDNLAYGYLKRPELTAESFIRNPFCSPRDKAEGRNSRIYKTGDLVKWLPDGNIEYIGRNDFQVKIHGLRIELGEIENKLSEFTAVNQAIVLCREHDNNKYLVAYYTINNSVEQRQEAENRKDENEMRSFLALKLPDYMIPSVFVYMEEMPFNTSGKIDRKALPSLEFKGNKDSYVPPSTGLEKELCKIWQEILGIEKIGIKDNFFSLGGDSIISIRVIAKMKKAGFSISVGNLFEYNTIEKLAKFIEHSAAESPPKKQQEYKPFSLITRRNIKELKIVKPEDIEDAYPAGYLQVGMLLESERITSGTYHDVFAYEINKKFDYDDFLIAFKKLIQKHSILRSSFVQNENYGYIILQYKEIDVSQKVYFIADKKVHEIIAVEKLNDFDLNSAGIFRLIITAQKDNSFTFIFSFHHAICDGWSIASLISEFADIFVNNKALEATADNLSYGMFISEEQKVLKDNKFKDFWKNYLDGYEGNTSNFILGTQCKPENNMVERVYELDSDKSNTIISIANQLEVSVDTIFLALYSVLLSCFYNREDIVLGIVVNNRLGEEGGDKLFGLFLNTIPLRVNINKTILCDIESLIKYIYQEKFKLHQYQAYPYGKIKSDFGAGNDIYQCAFNYVHFHIAEDNFEKGNIKSKIAYEKTNIPLFFDVRRNSNNFSLSMSGYTSFIDLEMMNKFIEYLSYYLEQIVSDKKELSLIIDNEYNQLINEWNRTEEDYPKDKTVYQLFEEQVNKTPDNMAVFFEDSKLSYKELNERANQLANTIREEYKKHSGEEIKSDTLIGIYLERSLEMIIGILGILKAGAAYVPFDIFESEKRFKDKVNDCGCRMIITSSGNIQKLASITDCDTIPVAIDSFQYEIPKATAIQEMINTPSDLAYIIYTSGSTGKPKGVMIEHKSLINVICDRIKKYNITELERILLFNNITFDASIEQIFISLLSGAALYIPQNSVIQSIPDFENYLIDNQITHLDTVPLFLSTISPHNNYSLKRIVVGGDVCNVDLALKWNKKLTFINNYGPTETTIDATSAIYGKGEVNDSINIGKAISNTLLYVLDINLQPVPVGVIGELYIGGACLARSYLNRNDLTKERFIHNPFATDDDKEKGYTRLYKTGDMVKWLPDSNIEYIGRNDNQIKIRGFRVELGEIENKLSQFDEINQAVILFVGYDNNKYLAAYYVSEKEIFDDVLHNYLNNILPDYMIPSIFIHMDKFPLNTSGKIDKKQLPDPEFKNNKHSYVAPRTETEKQLCSIWQEILGIEEIGITDDFFRLGGDSILAIQLSHKINNSLSGETNVQIEDFFTYKTIEKIMNNIENSTYDETENIEYENEEQF